MQFAAPAFLWALFALAIPVIVHLFDFRRYRRVHFSDNYLLRQLLEKNKKQSRLRRLIIMSLRMLAIAALVLVFARPYIPLENGTEKGGQLLVSVYLDNSMSMDMSTDQSVLFEEARNKAKEIALAYDQNVLFRLLLNDFDGMHERFVSRDEFIEMLTEAKVSSVFRNFSDVLPRLYDQMAKYPNADHHAYIISDFQKVSADIDQAEWKNASFFWIPLTEETPLNIAIDSIWFNAPIQLENKTIRVSARIRNYSDVPIEKIPVRLFVNDRQKGLTDIQISAGGSETVSFGFTVGKGGSHSGYIEIDDSPVLFDDVMHFAFDMATQIPVLHIKGGNATGTIQALFDRDSLFAYRQNAEQEIAFAEIGNADFIILDELSTISSSLTQELLNAMNNGSNVLLIPSSTYRPGNYSELFSALGARGLMGLDTGNTRVAGVDYLHPLFYEVFETAPEQVRLPEVNQSYILSINEGRSIMNMLNGRSYLNEYTNGNGHLYVMAVPLQDDFSDFTSNAMIVPTFIQMAFMSRGLMSLAYPLDYDDGIELPKITLESDQAPHVKSFDGSTDIVPAFNNGSPALIYLMGQIQEPGPYKITDGESTLRSFGLNYNRRESQPDLWTMEDLQQKSSALPNVEIFDSQSDITATLSEMQYGKRLWKTFLIFALIFLLAEVILLRLWKTM